MALTQQQRDERRHAKAAALQEEDLRLKVRPGTKQALAELMKWAGIEEQGEAMTLMIHRLHELGPGGALPLLEPPRHDVTLSPSVERYFLEQTRLMIRRDPGDEIIAPGPIPRKRDGSQNSRPRLTNNSKPAG